MRWGGLISLEPVLGAVPGPLRGGKAALGLWGDLGSGARAGMTPREQAGCSVGTASPVSQQNW